MRDGFRDRAAAVNWGGYNKEMSRAQSKAVFLTLLALLLVQRPLPAAPVEDLYVAQVATAGLSGVPLDDAFARALDEVLVKVTGQRYSGGDPASRKALGPAGPLVRQYQPVQGGQVRVSFDPVALRRRLDAVNLPVWADDRPRTLVLLPASPAMPGMPTGGMLPPGAAAGADPARAAAQTVLATATARGVAVVLATDATALSAASADPLLDPAATAAAAGADLLLVGRRLPTAGQAAVRWTLAQGADRAEWQGDLADGVHGLADRLAARYATTATAARQLRLYVEGIDSFDAYGRLQSYLRGVGLIQSANLEQITGSTLVFGLAVRGDASQLGDAFALQRVLEPVKPQSVSADGNSGTLVYRLATGR